MARIRTYDAPIDRIRPDDRGFTAQENAARRIQFATQDQVQALREGGRLAAQNIRAQANTDEAIAALQTPLAPRAGGGGGSAGGGGGGGSRGGTPAQAGATQGPREAAHAAAALATALGAGPARFVDVSQLTGRRRLLSELSASGDAQNSQPFSMRNLWGTPDYPLSPDTIDEMTREMGLKPGVTGDTVSDPDTRAADYREFDPLTSAYTGPPTPDAAVNEAGFMQRLWGYATSFGGSVASGFAAGQDAEVSADPFYQGPN